MGLSLLEDSIFVKRLEKYLVNVREDRKDHISPLSELLTRLSDDLLSFISGDFVGMDNLDRFYREDVIRILHEVNVNDVDLVIERRLKPVYCDVVIQRLMKKLHDDILTKELDVVLIGIMILHLADENKCTPMHRGRLKCVFRAITSHHNRSRTDISYDLMQRALKLMTHKTYDDLHVRSGRIALMLCSNIVVGMSRKLKVRSPKTFVNYIDWLR